MTGLPEPLTAKACSSSRAAPVHSQLEKQVCCSCSLSLRIVQSSTHQADQCQLPDEGITSTFAYSAHCPLKFCSQLQSEQSDNCSAYGVDSHVLLKDILTYVPIGCLHAALHETFDVLASHMLLSSQTVGRQCSLICRQEIPEALTSKHGS